MPASGYVQIGLIANSQALSSGLRAAERDIAGFKQRTGGGWGGSLKAAERFAKDLGGSELANAAKGLAGITTGLAEFGPAAFAIAGVAAVVNDLNDGWSKQEAQLAKVNAEYDRLIHTHGADGLAVLQGMTAEAERFGLRMSEGDQRLQQGLGFLRAERDARNTLKAASGAVDAEVRSWRADKIENSGIWGLPGLRSLALAVNKFVPVSDSQSAATKAQADAAGIKEQNRLMLEKARADYDAEQKRQDSLKWSADSSLAGRKFGGWSGQLDVPAIGQRGSMTAVRQAVFGAGDPQLAALKRQLAVEELMERHLAKIAEQKSQTADID